MSKFRTIEISDPQFERDNLRVITVKTPNLKGRGDICVYVPPNTVAADTLPIVILLHGVYGSAWSWPYLSGVHLTVDELIKNNELPPMILAMPSDGLWGDGSGYLQHNDLDFEKWIIDDVPNAVMETINGANEASPLFISGLSMGGFGALRIGAKYGDRLRAMSGHSSITSLEQMKLFVEEPPENYSQNNKIDEDLLASFTNYKKQLPPIYFDCGNEDLLIAYNRELHTKMEQENISHTYKEYAGGHEWPYWANHVTDSLKFFSSYM
jgi:putative tributyrin esterase